MNFKRELEDPLSKYSSKDLTPLLNEEQKRAHLAHHVAYYNDMMNTKETEDTCYETLHDLVTTCVGSLYNTAAQYTYHNLYFENLTSSEHFEDLNGPLRALIENNYGSFENFKQQLISKGKSHFGSGWLNLEYNEGKLTLRTYSNAEGLRNGTPLLTIDLWEHAYYLQYTKDRIRYLTLLVNQIDWKVVTKRLEKLLNSNDF